METEIDEKSKCIEKALMNYHHEKMEGINRSLSDIWKNTYKGNDILEI
jgi:DNA repair protein RAD50